MPRILAFDVNETIIDLSGLDPLFERAFGEPPCAPSGSPRCSSSPGWTRITGGYVDFTTAQHAALEMLAARTGTDLSRKQREEIVGGMRSLPAYPDVAPALDRLREGGFTLCALTNSPLEVVTAQLEGAGIADRFEAILSADQVAGGQARAASPTSSWHARSTSRSARCG